MAAVTLCDPGANIACRPEWHKPLGFLPCAGLVLSAIDADVVKTYVDAGLGVGIVASMACNPERDGNLVRLELRRGMSAQLPAVAAASGKRSAKA